MTSSTFPTARTRVALALLVSAVLGVHANAQRPVASGETIVDNARVVEELLSRPTTINVTRVSRKRAIQAAATSAKVPVQFRTEALEAYPDPVTVVMTRAPLKDVLERVLVGTTLVVMPDASGEIMIVERGGRRHTTDVLSDSGVVSGVVTDSATGQGLVGVTVTAAGTGARAVTGTGGTFRLAGVPVGARVVTVRRLGYQSASRPVDVPAGDSAVSVRFVLHPAATALAGVVTTAVGTQRRLEVGTDITTLNADSIRRIAPVSTVTDLLENRVPGLVVQRASGAPGAPARLRIRGIASIYASNDPIIVVDGVRRYSNQTTDTANAQYSVLNSIDVNSIERIDVLKGPSASALYGSDAANGVIVITTKRGQAGKTRWTFSTDQQRTTQLRTFPTLYYRLGYSATASGPPQRCSVPHGPYEYDTCIDDTVLVLNPLNDPRTTVLGTGSQQTYAASVSGGSPALQYFLGGQTSADLGLLKMSDADVAYLNQTTKASIPRWQRRPQSADQTGGTARITMQVTPALGVNLTSQLTRGTRSSTPLENAIGQYLGTTFTPADTSLVTAGIPIFRQRTTLRELMTSYAASADWRPAAWWTTATDAGYQTLARETRTLLRRGDCVVTVVSGSYCNPVGRLSSERSAPAMGAANVRSTLQLPSRSGVRLTPTLGLNYVRQTTSSVSYYAEDLPLGGTTNVGAKTVILGPDLSTTGVQLGVYLSTQVALFEGTGAPLYTEFGFRRDGSNAVGQNVKPTFPKLSFSYPLSNAAFFPFKQTVNMLRLRTAYGHSAVQPALGARDRTYRYGANDDGTITVTNPRVASIGNPDLKPERSTEWEGGLDLGMWNDRVAFALTGSRKLSRDALQSIALPLSVGGGQLAINIGSVRNTSTELDLRVTPVERDAVRWDVHGTYSRTRNILTKYAPDATGGVLLGQGLISGGQSTDFYSTRIVEGYPLNGVWLRPTVSYGDANGDGILQANEIIRSDSSSFVGGPLPNYEASFDTQLGLWRGWVTLSAAFSYQNGMSQANQAVFSQLYNVGNSTLRVFNDPTMPIAEQAAVLSGYAALHTVSALRFQSLSLRATMPTAVTRRLRASAASIALQGSNLGLWSNYSGSDPNVSGSIVGNALFDNGVLPLPRTWGLNVSLSY